MSAAKKSILGLFIIVLVIGGAAFWFWSEFKKLQADIYPGEKPTSFLNVQQHYIGKIQEFDAVLKPIMIDFAARKWDINVLASYGTPALRKALAENAEVFSKIHAILLQSGDLKKYNGIQKITIKSGIHRGVYTKSAQVEFLLQLAKGEARFDVDLVYQDNKWLIAGFELKSISQTVADADMVMTMAMMGAFTEKLDVILEPMLRDIFALGGTYSAFEPYASPAFLKMISERAEEMQEALKQLGDIKEYQGITELTLIRPNVERKDGLRIFEVIVPVEFSQDTVEFEIVLGVKEGEWRIYRFAASLVLSSDEQEEQSDAE